MQEFISQTQAIDFSFLPALAGIAIFLFGIKCMGEQLKVLAGSRMKTLIDKYTTNPVKGVFIGMFVTALIQSSSGTTALTISLVRSGLMSLRQAIGVIMGCNIGTTMTALLIGFNLQQFAPYFLIVGAFYYMIAKTPRNETIALLIIGFGSLFFGLSMIGDSLKVLATLPIFSDFAVELGENRFVGLFLGIVMTLIIQSSSATIGILQNLFNTGALDLNAVLPILLGDNVGTTITAMIAAIGGSIATKRTAAVHVTFNLLGAILFIVILPLFTAYVYWGANALGLQPMMQIAFAHASFNIFMTLLLLPFVSRLELFVKRIIGGKEDEVLDLKTSIQLDRGIIKGSPKLALDISYKATVEMAQFCHNMVDNTKKYVETKDIVYANHVESYENMVNELNKEISNYIVEVSGYPLSNKDNILISNLFYILKDLERVGDQCINIVEYFKEIYGANEELTSMAMSDLLEMFNVAATIVKDVSIILDNPTKEKIETLEINEELLDELEISVKAGYIDRVKNKQKMGNIAASVFVDIISDLERIGDHCHNISSKVKKVL